MEKEVTFRPGTKVQLLNKQNLNDVGVVRYVGPVKEKEGKWYGIELFEPKGKNDGTANGQRYFTCKQDYGVLAPSKYVQAYKEQLTTPQSRTQTTQLKDKKPISKVIPQSTQLKDEKKAEIQQQKQIGLKTGTQKVMATKTGTSSVVLQQKISDLEQQLEIQQSQLNQKIEIIEKQEVQIATLSEQSEKLEEITDLCDDFQKKNNELQLQLQEKNTEIQQLQENQQSKITIEEGDSDMQKLQKFVQLQREMEVKNQELMQMKEDFNKLKLDSQKQQNLDKQQIESIRNVVLAKNEDIQQLNKTIAKLQKSQEENEQRNNTQQSEQYEVELEKMKLQMQNVDKEKQQFQEQIDELNEQIEMLTLEIEDANLGKEEAEEKTKSIQKSLDDSKAEVQRLKEDINQNQKMLEQNIEDTVEEGSDDINTLKEGYKKLKQALKILHEKLEEEQLNVEEKELEIEEQLQNVEFEKNKNKQLYVEIAKLEDIKKTLTSENEDLQNQVNENADIVELFESITEEKLELEDQISKMGVDIKNLREQNRLDQELIDINEDEEKELQKIIQGKDYDIYELQEKIKQLEESIYDSEEQIVKYKELSSMTRKQYELLQEELDQTLQGNGVNDNLKKQQQLLVDYQNLLQENRSVYKEFLQSKIQVNSYIVEDSVKIQMYLEAIPQDLKKELHLEGLENYINTKKIIKNTFLCIKQLQNWLQSDKIVKEENLQLSVCIFNILQKMTQFLGQCMLFEQQVYQAETQEEVQKLMELPIITSIIGAGQFIDTILKNLMLDTISADISIGFLEKNVQIMQENEQPCDKNTQWNVSQLIKGLSIQNIFIKKLFDLKYMKQEHQVDVLYFTLQKRLVQFTDNILLGSEVPKQAEQIENSLNQILQQLKFVNEQNVVQFFSSPNNTETLQTEGSDLDDDNQMENVQSVQNTSDANQQDLIRIEDLRTYTIDVTNKINLINNNNTQKLQISDKDEKPKVFLKQAQEINQRITNVEKVIQNEKKLDQDLQTMTQNFRQVEKDLSNSKIVNQTLEQRVVKLELRGERVQVLEQNIKSYQQKEKTQNEQISNLRQDIDTRKKTIEKLKEQNKQLSQATQQSGIQNFLGQRSNAASSFLNNVLSTPNTQQVSQQYGQSILVNFFRKENTMLRNSEMKNRIKSLKNNSPMLDIYKKYKNISKKSDLETEDIQLNEIQDAVIKLNKIHFQVLDNLVSEKVINLQEINEKSKYNPDLKNQFFNNYLANKENLTSSEALKFEAFSICNKVLKKVQKDKQYKTKQEMPIQKEGSQMVKLASIDFNSEVNNTQKVSIIAEEWNAIKTIL